MKVTLVATTKPADGNEFVEDGNLSKQAMVFAGRNSGICYMSDDYFSEKAQDVEGCIKRANMNAKSGHYSVFGHYHVTLLLEGVPKIIAMILNNLTVYNTSEKSARYTMMKPATDLESDLYIKWKDKIEGILTALEVPNATKLAQENSRYMISVTTPTVMSYTIPYNRLLLLLKWIDNFTTDDLPLILLLFKDTNHQMFNLFESIKEKLEALKIQIMEACNFTSEDLVLEEHKGLAINLFGDLTYSNYLFDDKFADNKEYYGNVYESHYKATFACVAQLQRHRALDYRIKFLRNDNIFVPEFIQNTPLEKEWRSDMSSLIDEGITPQGMLLSVTETGSFEDFVLKTKERLCSRAQLETMKITGRQMLKFYGHKDNLSNNNRNVLKDITAPNKGIVIPRCCFHRYICKEPCPIGADGLKRNY